MKAEIISIGTEIMLGEITDTNASFLASQLPSLGIELYWVTQVGDSRPRMVEVLKRAWQRSDLILTTGGLGPTGDDLTREAIAELFGEEMRVDPQSEAALRERFGRMMPNMPLSNLKQAMLIPSARAIPNPNGTAPGWLVKKDGRILVAMPGPPSEMQPMWRQVVMTHLSQGEAIILSRTLKTFGLSEGAVGELVNPMFASVNPTFGVYAKADGIHLRLAARARSRAEAQDMLAEGETSIRKVLGEHIWGTDDDTLGVVMARLLVDKGLSLASMEDFSAGNLAVSIAEIPSSASFYKGGLLALTDEAKATFGVKHDVIAKYSASSAEMAMAMAEAARTLLKADIGLSISAAGETKERPGGVTHIGLSDKGGSRAIARPRRMQVIVASAFYELRKGLIS